MPMCFSMEKSLCPLYVVPTERTDDTEAYGLKLLKFTDRIDAARHTTEGRNDCLFGVASNNFCGFLPRELQAKELQTKELQVQESWIIRIALSSKKCIVSSVVSSKKCRISTIISSKKCGFCLSVSSKKCIFAKKPIRNQIIMKRKIYNQLLAWKEGKDRKPLMLLGARQVGKTWIMQHFGENEYKKVAYINCDDEPRMKQLFELAYNIERILITIQAITGVRVTPGDTLIILDEIQEIPRGLHSLKYFCEKAPEYHIMVAGSLLGVTLGKGESFPVGKVDMLTMYPMDYEEFLDAIGNEGWLDLLHSNDWALIEIMKPKMVEALRQYYYVGGMPGVVSKYIENADLKQVRNIQRDILEAYRRDISKHTTAAESTRIRQVLDSLPTQLAKENKKFVYGAVRQGSRAKDFELAIQWLMDAGIVHKVSRIREPKMPLKFYEDIDAFKLFLLDCGLFACMTDAPADQMLIGDNAFTEFKGAFTEQYVMQQLLVLGIKPYYWSNAKTPAEIDFVVQYNNRVVPVEVKAEVNVRARSLAQFVKDNPELKGLRISMKGYADQEWMENIPLVAIGAYFTPQT